MESGKWLALDEGGHTAGHEGVAAVVVAAEGAGVEKTAFFVGGVAKAVGMHSTQDGRLIVTHQIVKLLIVGTVEEMVAGMLTEGNLELGHLVAEVVLVVVEMLLEEVEQHRDMWCAVYVLQLVAREFGHHDAVFIYVVEDVEEGDADIAGEDTAREQMMDEAGGGGLALGAGDADGKVAVDLQEEVCQAGKAEGRGWKMKGRDAGRLDDHIERPFVVPLFVRASPSAVLHLCGYGVLRFRDETLDEALGALPFAAVAGDEYCLAGETGFQLVFSVHAACSI